MNTNTNSWYQLVQAPNASTNQSDSWYYLSITEEERMEQEDMANGELEELAWEEFEPIAWEGLEEYASDAADKWPND